MRCAMSVNDPWTRLKATCPDIISIPSPFLFQEINDDVLIEPIMIDVIVLPRGILRNRLRHD